MDASQMNQFIGNFNTIQQATEGMSVNSFEEGLMMFGAGLLGILIASSIIFIPIKIREWTEDYRNKKRAKYIASLPKEEQEKFNWINLTSEYNLIRPKIWI